MVIVITALMTCMRTQQCDEVMPTVVQYLQCWRLRQTGASAHARRKRAIVLKRCGNALIRLREWHAEISVVVFAAGTSLVLGSSVRDIVALAKFQSLQNKA